MLIYVSYRNKVLFNVVLGNCPCDGTRGSLSWLCSVDSGK